MSDDPETARQIEELADDDRPLLVLDVDDVVLEFIRPFPHFLQARGFGLTFASFRLTGSIAERASGRLVEQAEVTRASGRVLRCASRLAPMAPPTPWRRSATAPRSSC
jgi:hypothetical protein